jgi:hypothetical protein
MAMVTNPRALPLKKYFEWQDKQLDKIHELDNELEVEFAAARESGETDLMHLIDTNPKVHDLIAEIMATRLW